MKQRLRITHNPTSQHFDVFPPFSALCLPQLKPQFRDFQASLVILGLSHPQSVLVFSVFMLVATLNLSSWQCPWLGWPCQATFLNTELYTPSSLTSFLYIQHPTFLAEQEAMQFCGYEHRFWSPSIWVQMLAFLLISSVYTFGQ